MVRGVLSRILRAGYVRSELSHVSVSPLTGEEDMPRIEEQDESLDEDVEKVNVDPEDDVVKKLPDPRLPSKEEV